MPLSGSYWGNPGGNGGGSEEVRLILKTQKSYFAGGRGNTQTGNMWVDNNVRTCSSDKKAPSALVDEHDGKSGCPPYGIGQYKFVYKGKSYPIYCQHGWALVARTVGMGSAGSKSLWTTEAVGSITSPTQPTTAKLPDEVLLQKYVLLLLR